MKKLLTLFALAMMLGVQNANAAYQGIKLKALDGSNATHGTENPSALVDGKQGTKWGGGRSQPFYIVLKASSPILATKYVLRAGNDTNTNTGRSWKQWKIYGGNFASDAQATRNASSGWTLIDEKSNQNLNKSTAYATTELTLSNPGNTYYTYFWIEVEALETSGEYGQMDEFWFSEYTKELTFTSLSSTKTGGEGGDKLIDGTSTKWGQSVSTANPGWVIFKASKALSATDYALTEANDTPGDPGRQWKKWKIYGANFYSETLISKDAPEWVLLDSKNVADSDFPVSSENNTFQHTNFTMSEGVTDKFEYFMIVVEETRTSGKYGQMGEFCFYPNVEDASATWARKVTLAKSFNRGALAEDYPIYTEYTGCFSDLDATLAAANGDYTTLAGQLDFVALLCNAMSLYNNGNDYAAFYGSTTWGDGHWSQLVDGDAGSQTNPSGDKGTKWGGDFSGTEGDPGYMQYVVFRSKEPIDPYFYKLVTGWDTKSYQGRNWKTWSVYGGNFDRAADATVDNAGWVLLDERVNVDEVYMPMENCYPATFDFNNSDNFTGPFSYYMVKIFAAHEGKATQMNEIYICTKAQFEEMRAPLVAYFANLDPTRPIEASQTANLAEFNTKYAELCTTADAVQMTLLYNRLVELRAILEKSMDFVELNTEAAPVGDVYQIGTAKGLALFSNYVNTYSETDLDAVLTADIVLTNEYMPAPIGTGSNPYAGTFNGQQHIIKNFVFNNTSQSNVGLFGTINGATIQNVMLDGASVAGWNNSAVLVGEGQNNSVIQNCAVINSTVSGHDHVAAIVAKAYSTTITKCFSNANVSSDYAQAGGMAGVIFNATVTYNIFTGTVTNTSARAGGLVCLTDAANDNSFVNHNMVAAKSVTCGASSSCYPLIDTENRGGTFADNFILETTVYTKGSTTQSVEATNKDGETGLAVTKAQATSADFYTTTLGWDLTNDWKLYEGYYPILKWMDSYVTSYSNISTPAELVAFANRINNGFDDLVPTGLDADINLSGVAITPIGTEANKYTGTFDGQDHAITNFSYTSTGDYNGLFGFINNATVKNFSISGSLTSTHKENGAIGYADGASVVSGVHSSLDITVNCRTHSGGVVGASASDTSTLRVDGCSYSGTLTIEGTDADVTGGIIGYTYYGTIQNCIFSGTINGNVDNKPYGGILGYARIETFGGIHNCLVLGKIVTNASNTTASILIGKWNGPATSNVGNNYYLPNAGSSSNVVLVGGNTDNVTAPILVTTEQLASGEITAKLGYAFHQNLGTDATPTLDKTKGYVTQIGTAGYSTQYITDSDVTIPSNIEAFAGVINGSNITLESITDKIAAGEPVVLRGTEGIYNFMPTTGATEATENNLKGSDGTVTGGDNIYALAKKGNPAEVGFYPVSSSVKIPAGRVYLEYTAPTPVKGFYGFEEDDATGISLMEDGRSKMEDGAIYNVAGQRISKMQKGINIVNGKKVLK